jgi:glycerol-3-phosphate acyltransferase PlsX
VKEAGRILREANLPGLSYHGFVEGDDIGKGTTSMWSSPKASPATSR